MNNTALREPEMGLTFEKVWVMFQEADRRIQETERLIQENALQMKETDRLIQENALQMRETDRKFKETDRKISKLGSRIGDLVEELITPDILEKFNKLGYVFGKVAPNVRYGDSHGKIIAEVDLLLENGDIVLAVEAKTNLTDSDVRDHVEEGTVHCDSAGDLHLYMQLRVVSRSERLCEYFSILQSEEQITHGLYFEEIPEEVYTLKLPKALMKDDGAAWWEWTRFFRCRKREEYEMVAGKNLEIWKAVDSLYEGRFAR
jgi:hypothetical protein